MNKTNDTNARQDVRDDIIEIGVASLDTMGPSGTVEPTGIDVLPGISEE